MSRRRETYEWSLSTLLQHRKAVSFAFYFRDDDLRRGIAFSYLDLCTIIAYAPNIAVPVWRPTGGSMRRVECAGVHIQTPPATVEPRHRRAVTEIGAQLRACTTGTTLGRCYRAHYCGEARPELAGESGRIVLRFCAWVCN